jgi:signal transduction histidine kinase
MIEARAVSQSICINLRSLPENVSQSIRFVRESGENLGEMVKSLLLMAIAKHAEIEIEMESIDPEKLARTCRHELTDMIRDYHGSMHIEERLQPCPGHAPWMRQILTNLFSNGLKYGGRPPKITSSMAPAQNGMIRYLVSDNGAGCLTGKSVNCLTSSPVFILRTHQELGWD